MGRIAPATCLALLLLTGGCPGEDLPADDDDTTGDDDTVGDDDSADDDDMGDDDSADDDDTGDDDSADDDDTGDDDTSCDIVVPTQYPTIQGAIEAAAFFDAICVEAGTYHENIDYQGKFVSVTGVAGAAETIIDGGQAGPVVRFVSGENYVALLEGFTLTNGQAEFGGGLLVEDASPGLSDLVVENNRAEYGGGVSLVDSTTTLERVVVTGNTAFQNGGGIYLASPSATLSHVSVTDNVVLENDGGGIYIMSGEPVLDRVLIEGNVAFAYGGGLVVYAAAPSLTNVSIENNTAGGSGGVRIITSSPVLTNVTVAGNTAEVAFGGGLSAHSSSSPVLSNVRIFGNQSAGAGGGVVVWGSQATCDQVTITGNSTGSDGGGVYLSESTLELANTLVTGNSSAGNGGGIHARLAQSVLIATHANIYGNSPDDLDGVGDPVGTDGNVSEDPGFLDTAPGDPLDWDLHLSASSPLIDAGDPAILDPDGSPADMGAYGGPGADAWDLDWDGFPEWWLPGPYDPATSPGMDCDDRDDDVGPGNGC